MCLQSLYIGDLIDEGHIGHHICCAPAKVITHASDGIVARMYTCCMCNFQEAWLTKTKANLCAQDDM